MSEAVMRTSDVDIGGLRTLPCGEIVLCTWDWCYRVKFPSRLSYVQSQTGDSIVGVDMRELNEKSPLVA